MSLWNPKSVSSRPAAASPSSDAAPWPADPTRTAPGWPTIGQSEAFVGRTSTVSDRPRHPIGFAPPEEPQQPERFRTEISFRRHHELPRAAAISDPTADRLDPEWQTPAPHVSGQECEQVEPFGPFEEIQIADGAVPFYRREISFRRKKAAPEQTDVEGESLSVADPLADDVSGEIENEVVTDSEPTPLSEIDSVGAVEVALSVDIEPVADEVVANARPIPFYKRELGFGRNKVVAEPVVLDAEIDAEAAVLAHEPDHDVELGPLAEAIVLPEPVDELVDVAAGDVELPTEEPAETNAVPFYKRELGFRRRKPALLAVEDADEIEQIEQIEEASAAAATPSAVADEADPASAVETDLVSAEASHDEVVEESTESIGRAVDAEPEFTADAVEDADPAPVADGPLPADETPAEEMPFAEADMPTDEGSASSSFHEVVPPKEKPAKRQRKQPIKGRTIVGLKIGASQLAAAVVQSTESGHELVELARRPLAEGIVVDGDIRDELALSNALKSFFDDEKLPKRDVRIGLSSNRIGVRAFEMEGIEDPERFDNAVRFKAHEVLPVTLNESMLDYRVLGSRIDEEGKEIRRVLLVVAPRDQVEPYQRIAAQAGIALAGADLEALALLRAFVPPALDSNPGEPDTAKVVVAIGHESSTLLVAGHGVCEFTRVFDWGGSALEDAIVNALDVRPVEAATMLRHLSLSGPGRQYDALDDVARAKATDAVRQRLTPFARELVNSLQFYQTQAESLGIGGIVITGGTSHLEGLDAALHQMIGVPVTIGDPFTRVIRAGTYDAAIEAAIGSMSVSIGLAIDEDAARGVNLLPKASSGTRNTRATLAKFALPLAAAIPFAALAFLYAGAHSTANDRKAELGAVEAQIAALPKPVTPVLETGVVGDEAARATAVANLLGGRVAWDGVFSDLGKVLPANVWLTKMSLTQPGAEGLAGAAATPQPLPGQGQAAPTAVSVEGYTYTQPDVALLLARLATLPTLQRVTLTSSAAEVVGSKDVVHFVIVADLNQSGGAS